jgi:hypothetical protein
MTSIKSLGLSGVTRLKAKIVGSQTVPPGTCAYVLSSALWVDRGSRLETNFLRTGGSAGVVMTRRDGE